MRVFKIANIFLHVFFFLSSRSLGEENGIGLNQLRLRALEVLGPDGSLETLKSFCSCDLDLLFWDNVVQSTGYKCWTKQRKISPGLFSESSQLLSEVIKGEGKRDFSPSHDSRMQNLRSCPVGTLLLATVMGSVWEAHDLGESHWQDLEEWGLLWREGVVESPHNLPSYEQALQNFFRTDLAKSAEYLKEVRTNAELRCAEVGALLELATHVEESGLGVVIPKREGDVEESNSNPKSRFLDSRWIFDSDRFSNLLSRMTRKLDGWLQLLYDEPHEEPPAPRELEGFRNFDEKKNLSLCLCMVYGNGAKTFEHTLETYKSMGLLDAAEERFVVYYKFLKRL